jgi:hypothetical protein
MLYQDHRSCRSDTEKAAVTLSRDPIFEKVTKDHAPIEESARKTSEIWLMFDMQLFLVGR